MLFSEAWEKHRSDKRIEGYSTLILKMYGFQCNLLQRYFGDSRMDNITTEDLKQYLRDEAEYLKPSSLGHRVRFIKWLFKWSHEEGFILKKPAAKLKEPKLWKRIPKFLSKHEIEHLAKDVIHRWRMLCLNFFYSTGCRIGEVAKLNRNDINFKMLLHSRNIKNLSNAVPQTGAVVEEALCFKRARLLNTSQKGECY